MIDRNGSPHAARRKAPCALAGAAFALFLAAGPALAAPTAQTENGPVTGLRAEGMKEFLGIRYAAPPTGALRWQPPQPVSAALATTDASAFGPHCTQVASPYGVASTAEDCLYLNVYVPEGAATARRGLPVMVWIHGGALVVGESDLYDPAPLVTQGDVIVVTINYRLGYFGFLATSGLDAEGHLPANYGLMDQQFALSWVQRNIAGFGGDPARVTMFGESAGGLSTLSNYVSPNAYGLFSRAIVESGAYALHLPTLAASETAGDAVVAGLGCAATDTACQRGLSVAAILAAEPSGVTTIVDGTLLPLSIDAALQAGRFNKVPLMNGSNHDEYRLFTVADAALTAAAYDGAFAAAFGATLGAAAAPLYPVARYAQPVLGLAAAITDDVFACPAQLVDRYAAQYVPVYAYEFNDRHAPEDFLPPAGYPFGAAHASEIQFLFNIPELPGTRPLNGAEQALSATMVQYWTRFAAKASPDAGGEPAWFPYAVLAGEVQSLAPSGAGPESNFTRVHRCSFWDPIIEP